MSAVALCAISLALSSNPPFFRRLRAPSRGRRFSFISLLRPALTPVALSLLAVKVKRAWGQQPAKIRRIGILDDAPMWQPFRQALRELGYVDEFVPKKEIDELYLNSRITSLPTAMLANKRSQASRRWMQQPR